MATDLNREFSLSAPFFSILLSPYADYAQISFEKVSHWLGSWPNGALVPAGLCIDHELYMCSVITKSLYIIVEQHWATINPIHKSHQIKPHMFPGKTFATYFLYHRWSTSPGRKDAGASSVATAPRHRCDSEEARWGWRCTHGCLQEMGSQNGFEKMWEHYPLVI